MALSKQDLNDIKNLMAETIAPMFEEQTMQIDGINERIENKLLGMRSDIRDFMDRIFALESVYQI